MKNTIIVSIAAISLLATTGAAIATTSSRTQPIVSTVAPKHLEEPKEPKEPEMVTHATSAVEVPQSAPEAPTTLITNQTTQPQNTEQDVTPENSNPYYEGGQEYITYNKRVVNGQAVGMWGNVQSWPRAAQSQGVSVGKTPQLNATCISGSMLDTVISFTDTEITIEDYLGNIHTRQIANAGCTFIY